MRLKFWMTGLGVAAIAAAVALASPSAQAQTTTQKKKQTASNQTRVATAPRARIRVERRSFLDLGTEALPGERKYMDYAFPPGYSVLGSALGPGRDFRRQPLLDPWDVPGTNKGWW